MNNLMIFEGHEVEVLEVKGQVLFNPKHVAECLEIADVNSSIRNFNEKQVVKLTNSDAHNLHIRKLNNAGENFLTESGVYKLVFKSHKPNAEVFTDWIADEVLPSIRKTGTYGRAQIPQTTDGKIALLAQGHTELREEIESIRQELDDFKQDMPLLAVECDRITTAVHKRGVDALSGKNSNAYKDASLRGKVYQDIHRELKRQFGVSTYKAIKRSQCETAVSIITEYELPIVLQEQIENCNAQISMEVE